MNQNLAMRKVVGFLFVSVAGTFLHFLYDLTGKNMAAALVSAVNESIWEHMKLIFYPMLLFSLAEKGFAKEKSSAFRCSKLAGILLSLTLIPVLYYSYTGIFGISVDWLNIAIFFLAAGAAYYLEFRMEAGGSKCVLGPVLWWAVLLLIASAFTAATFCPPRLPLFRDPLTGTYGVWAIT